MQRTSAREVLHHVITYIADRMMRYTLRILNPLRPRSIHSGPIFRRMNNILQSFDFHHDYRQGRIDRQTFFNQLMKHRCRLMWLGMSEREVHDAARLPANEEAY